MAEDSNNNNDGVFIYTEGVEVPMNVVRVRVHPSVTVIPEKAFKERTKLEEVELCEGLLEIGAQAFEYCNKLKRINIPSTVAIIEGWAFAYTAISNIHTPDVEINGMYAFAATNLIKFTVPSQTTRTQGMFSCCGHLMSVELPLSVRHIEGDAFSYCSSLRNVALPFDAEVVVSDQFYKCRDLHKLLGTTEQFINALKHRFDNLPIHKMIYYQSYTNMTVDQLNEATSIRISQRRSKINPTGKQQDCLGMTPLHIMTCSTIQNLELYKVLVDKYPDTLVTEDRWGALPLLYAVWGRAPDEIVQYLIDSYKSVYPDYVFNWTSMVTALGIAGAPLDAIQYLLDLQKECFSDQLIDWDAVIEKLAVEPRMVQHGVDRVKSFQFLVKCSFMERINAIGLKYYRNKAINTVMGPGFIMPHEIDEGETWLDSIKSKLAEYEARYHELKESTIMIELSLWKMKLNNQSKGQNKNPGRQNKKKKIDESDLRGQCRVNCGADVIIRNVLPYLLPGALSCESESDSDESSSSSSYDYESPDGNESE